MPERSLLIVNADDYGLTTATSDAILTAHDRGIVTSTSVLALAPAAGRSLSALAATGLAVGVHLALVGEDPPLLSRQEVPTLVDRRGRLASSWRVLVPRLAARRVDPVEIRAELDAQIQLVRRTVPELSHVDTHQHLHLWPSVGTVVVELAREHDIPGVRIPWSASPGARGAGIRRLARRLAATVGGSGRVAAERSAGLDGAGSMDADRLVQTIADLAADRPASAELGTHPGALSDPDRARYRWGYRWADELDALTSERARMAVDEAGFTLGTYRDLASGTEAR